MAWLNFGLPLEEEWEVEKQARAIRDCDDIDKLRDVAEQAFRAWVQQTDIVGQLIQQLADAEALLAQAGIGEPVDEEYLEWARSLYPDAWRSGQS
jgi:fructose-1,6-bisphosphatase